MTGRRCVDCKNFNFSMGSDGFGEVDAVCECSEGAWAMAKNDFKHEDELRKHMASAETCQKFEEAD